MLTKEECEKALMDFELINRDGDQSYSAFKSAQRDVKILWQLIHEHFENPPLKIEEIKKYEPIFDNEDLGWIFVSNINKLAKCISCLDVDGDRHVINFKENRFYRKEVHD